MPSIPSFPASTGKEVAKMEWQNLTDEAVRFFGTRDKNVQRLIVNEKNKHILVNKLCKALGYEIPAGYERIIQPMVPPKPAKKQDATVSDESQCCNVAADVHKGGPPNEQPYNPLLDPNDMNGQDSFNPAHNMVNMAVDRNITIHDGCQDAFIYEQPYNPALDLNNMMNMQGDRNYTIQDGPTIDEPYHPAHNTGIFPVDPDVAQADYFGHNVDPAINPQLNDGHDNIVHHQADEPNPAIPQEGQVPDPEMDFTFEYPQDFVLPDINVGFDIPQDGNPMFNQNNMADQQPNFDDYNTGFKFNHNAEPGTNLPLNGCHENANYQQVNESIPKVMLWEVREQYRSHTFVSPNKAGVKLERLN
ncbi:hypothetical protein CPB84DRAFT_1795951 [Gymnopilus junonius]|uniref:Uncharacterized protein n=1 Tax=Gymnopilus junonius TaxID=109634 RepID=A0A9P5TFZ3_GYMJU|nr:hypothetical protein CPB84DRAFT_1795951 [Gymnopilus junonius]